MKSHAKMIEEGYAKLSDYFHTGIGLTPKEAHVLRIQIDSRTRALENAKKHKEM